MIKYVLPLTLMLSGCDDFHKLPIMKCDPITLKTGMNVKQVKELCGEPDEDTAHKTDWYPLSGDTREHHRVDYIMHYGSVMSENHNVNLYFDEHGLRSVQIYGDYK